MIPSSPSLSRLIKLSLHFVPSHRWSLRQRSATPSKFPHGDSVSIQWRITTITTPLLIFRIWLRRTSNSHYQKIFSCLKSKQQKNNLELEIVLGSHVQWNQLLHKESLHEVFEKIEFLYKKKFHKCSKTTKTTKNERWRQIDLVERKNYILTKINKINVYVKKEKKKTIRMILRFRKQIKIE